MPRAPRDPKLVTARGVAVPYVPYDQVYKHLGLKRRCDGVCSAIFQALYKKVKLANKRISKLVRPSHRRLRPRCL